MRGLQSFEERIIKVGFSVLLLISEENKTIMWLVSIKQNRIKILNCHVYFDLCELL